MAQNIDIRLVVKDDGSVVVKKFGDESEKSFKKATKSTDSFTKSMKALKQIAAALIGIKLGKEMFDVFNKTTQLADSVAKLSTRLGISTDALQKMQYVAERSGLSVEAMNVGLQRMIRRAADASRGVGEAKDAFKALGISTDQLINLSPEQLFLEITRGLDRLNTEGSKVATLFKIFDTEGVGVKQAMKEGAEGVQALFDRFDDLNAMMGPDFLKASEEYQDALTDIKYAWRGFVVYLGKEILPLINDNIDEIVDGIKWAAEAMDTLFNLSNKKKIEAINNQISVLEKNISDLENPTGIQAVGKAVNEFFGHDSKERIAELRAEINRLIEEKKRYEDEEAAKIKDREKGKGGRTPVAPPKTQEEIKAEEERAKRLIEIEQERLEALALADAEQKAKLRQAQIDHDIAMDEFRANQVQKEKEAAEEKAKQEQMVSEQRKAARDQALADAAYFFQEMGKKNKVFFRLYQATAIAETIISTYEGAQKAFTALAGIPYVGPALGVAAAAAAIAAGMARVAAIANQKPEGAAKGKVVNKPTVLEVGEGAKSEAVVPLDNGSQIPVNFRNGGPGGANVNINISAADSKSFNDMVKRNPKAIVDPIIKAMQKGYKPLTNTQRRVM